MDRDRQVDLPWGHWLVRRGSVFEDETGRSWCSVRDAFWTGRLGFPEVHYGREQLELLLRVLLSLEGHGRFRLERAIDLFSGDLLMDGFYMSWLATVGFIGWGDASGAPRGDPLDMPLSPEGRSVLLMLQATRDTAWADLPAAELLDAIADASRDGADDAREIALQDFERSASRLPHVFERVRIGRLHAITLTSSLVDARMPTRSRMWSLSFGDARARDDLFAWLAARVDRWEDWRNVAYRRGAAALTDHLLTMFVACVGTPI